MRLPGDQITVFRAAGNQCRVGCFTVFVLLV